MTTTVDSRHPTPRLRALVERLPGHERFRGYGIMTLPFDSGHVLGLRVMPDNDYAPFRAVWHRTPKGRWSMYVDAPHHEVFCPRLFGPALDRSGPATIDVAWPTERTLTVRMEEPSLDWTIRLDDTLLTRAFNRMLPRIPLKLYRHPSVLYLIGKISKGALGLGDMDLEGPLPGGQVALVKPREIRLVGNSRAILEGRDLGRPVVARENPRTGWFRWPARGVLARGDVHVTVDDPAERRRRLALFRAGGRPDQAPGT